MKVGYLDQEFYRVGEDYYREFKFPYEAIDIMHSDPHYRVQNRIRLYRNRLGLSQRELASLIGCSRNAISAFENNKFQPSAHYILLLCAALGVRFEHLFAVVWCD